MKIGILLVALCAGITTLQAQTDAPQPAPGTPWSLSECIGYAQRNNINIQQRALTAEKNEVALSTSKLSRLPNLNASVGADASFGRVLSRDNTYKDNNQRSGSLNLSSSIPLFEGMRINHEIKAGKLDLAAAMQDLARAKEDLAINITTLYLQVLYNKELVGISERQVELSALQLTRSRELSATGKKPESVIYESEALCANDQLSLTQARNDLQLALLDLSQALNRESAAGFDIVMPTLDTLTLATLHHLGSAEQVYAYAAENRPNIKAEQLRLQSADHSVAIARAALYPSLSLSGGYGTGIYSGSGQDKLWAQVRNNSREYVGLSLSIPIFNRVATRNSVRTAKLNVQTQQLVVTEAERALRKEIEQAWYNAQAAYAKYTSAERAHASAQVAFGYEQEKADAGRSTIFDFNDAKTRLEKAEAEAAQAKYEFLFRSKILDFYRGEQLTL